MVHEKTRWKWHQCLQARYELITYDSECENDDYPDRSLIMEDKQGSNEILSNKQEQLKVRLKLTEGFTSIGRVKEEAKVAFAMTAKMARMQVEMEREELETKRSPIYEFIGIHRPFSRTTLESMNIGQLQVLLNDLYRQIELNNNQLVNLLIDRDVLSMEQDSILVDIEDFSQRSQERRSLSVQNYIYIVERPEITPPKRSFFKKLFCK